MSISNPNHSIQVLDALVAQIRAALEALRTAESNALDRALEVGDRLNEAQGRVSSGWKRWLQENCSLSPSTALLYQQLARHRPKIEAKIEQAGELSLRAARRLIAKSKGKKERSETEKPDLVAGVSEATDAELTEAFRQLGFDRFMRVIPEEFRPQLAARAGGQVISRAKAQHPNIRLRHLGKKHLALIQSAEPPTPTSH